MTTALQQAINTPYASSTVQSTPHGYAKVTFHFADFEVAERWHTFIVNTAALQAAIAQPVQMSRSEKQAMHHAAALAENRPAQPEQPAERNFCERCGKRLGDVDSIHTCTPPALQPLTDDQLFKLREHNELECISIQEFRLAARCAEAAHNIKAEKD